MTRRPVKVVITYCAACGYEPQALGLAGALLRGLRGELASLELVPWYDSAFDVVVDGDLLHSMLRDGGFPADPATIIAAARERSMRVV
jgi:selenoprotein W-related protein